MFDDIKKEIGEAADGFKKMQMVLLGFCALTTIAIVMVAVKLSKG